MSEWVTVPLGDLATYVNGRAFKPEDWRNQGTPIVRIENLNNPNAAFNYYQGEVEKQYKIDDGDILVSWSASLDAFVWNGGSAVLNQHIFKVLPNNNRIDKDFLFFTLKKAVKGLSDLVHGATMKHVTKPQFESFQVDIPKDKNYQQQIATQLKAQLAEVEKAKQASAIQFAEVDNLANTIISESLQKGTNSFHSLDDVLEEVKTGIGSSWASYPVYGATRSGIALAKEPPGKNPQRYKPIVPGTVFYNPMRILIGSIAYAEDDVPPGITSPDYVVLKGKKGLVNSRWFYYWLRSPFGQHCINSLARGAVRERMLFNRLAEGEIELPDYEVQLKASKWLQSIKPLKASLKQQRADIDAMPTKLLSKVFHEV